MFSYQVVTERYISILRVSLCGKGLLVSCVRRVFVILVLLLVPVLVCGVEWSHDASDLNLTLQKTLF